jgi:hypothetical protein
LHLLVAPKNKKPWNYQNLLVFALIFDKLIDFIAFHALFIKKMIALID